MTGVMATGHVEPVVPLRDAQASERVLRNALAAVVARPPSRYDDSTTELVRTDGSGG